LVIARSGTHAARASSKSKAKQKIIDRLVDYQDLNVLLKRPLKDGREYDRYFNDSSCRPKYLGKSDTAFTVRQMKKWAYANARQTKKLALGEFAGKTLQDTCNAIFDFLFHHVQYELDGTDQNLKSPACTWATREKGTDCKSYSIFASTILTNLGIKHYFRRVKQPNDLWSGQGIDPNLWSHVYVIVPKNQKNPRTNKNEYFVIDATVSGNNEVSYSAKSDTFMSKVNLPHYGLQAPARTPSLSDGRVPFGDRRNAVSESRCTCTPIATPTPQPLSPIDPIPFGPKQIIGGSSLGPEISVPKSPSTPVLVPIRTTRTTTPTAPPPPRTTIRNVEGSNLRRITALKSPARNGLGFYNSGQSGVAPTTGNTKGQDWATFGASIYSSATQGAAQNRAATQYGSREEKLNAIGKSGATSAIFHTVGSGAAAFTYGISAILTLIPAETWEKTFGQWFKDGFKCYGASWTPTTAQQTFNIEAEYIKQKLVETMYSWDGMTFTDIEASINAFWEFFYNVQSGSRRWLDDNARDCTRDGLKLLVESLNNLVKELETGISKALSGGGHLVQKAGTKKVTYAQNKDNGYPGGHPPYDINVPQFKIKVNPAVLQPEEQQAVQIYEKEVKKTQAGFGTTGILALAALAAGAYIYNS